jgi:hypothetical protein
MSGARSVNKLVKIDATYRYGRPSARAQAHVPMIAAMVDEPSHDRTVDMLAALSPEEALYYAAECNVVSNFDRKDVLFRELESKFGFVGGSLEEYSGDFGRQDLPPDMWSWMLPAQVKAVACFSVVPKKAHGRQRKLKNAGTKPTEIRSKNRKMRRQRKKGPESPGKDRQGHTKMRKTSRRSACKQKKKQRKN